MLSEIKTNLRAQSPVEVSKIVFVRRKPVVYTRGEMASESSPFIGSAFSGGSVLRGLDFKEEEAYLKAIIGVSPDSDKWEAATSDYWKNMRVRVPEGVGIPLEIGFKYESKADADYAEESGDYAVKQSKGIPIKIADYILWRYCLVYKHVANNLESIHKSNNIRFFLFSKEAELKQEHNELQARIKAQKTYFSVLGDRTMVDHILTMFNEPVDSKTSVEKDIALDRYATTHSNEFVKYATDKDIVMKAFIEKCITKGLLKRYANTQTIAYDTTPIGSDLNEAVIFLSRPNGNTILNTLKAKMKEIATSQSLTPIKEGKLPDEISDDLMPTDLSDKVVTKKPESKIVV